MPTGDARTNQWLEWFRQLGDYRNSVLIAVGLVYLLGYVVWFIIAWKQGLGPVPVLDTQYFVAGFPMLLMITGLLRMAVP